MLNTRGLQSILALTSLPKQKQHRRITRRGDSCLTASKIEKENKIGPSFAFPMGLSFTSLQNVVVSSVQRCCRKCIIAAVTVIAQEEKCSRCDLVVLDMSITARKVRWNCSLQCSSKLSGMHSILFCLLSLATQDKVMQRTSAGTCFRSLKFHFLSFN